ncbi:MAG: CRISPR-associated endonuclease Cas1 [Cyanobacteria bacterium J06627_28]
MNDRLTNFLNPENFELAWDKVATNRGCAGVDRETIAQFGRHKQRKLQQLIEQVANDSYQPLPLRQIAIPKKSKGWRILRVPAVRDRVVQQALLNRLHPIMEPQFEPESYAYRPGRSHKLAVEKVTAWHRQGYEWLLDADIVSYFDHVGHGRLLAEVAERLGEGVRAEDSAFSSLVLRLVGLWNALPTLTRQGLVLPTEGIPQGSVVSPILANIYLDDFDEALQASRFKLVRFADDFVVMGKSQAQVKAAQVQVRRLLEEIGLRLHPEKTRVASFDDGFQFLGHRFLGDLVVPMKRPKQKQKAKQIEESELKIVHADAPAKGTQMQQEMLASLQALHRPIPPPLFVVLGYQVRKEKRVEIESKEKIWRRSMSTLYLVQQGTTVKKDYGRFVIRTPKEETVEVLIREVERILVFGNVQLTTQVLTSCLDAGITVVFLSQLGDYKGHLVSEAAAGMNASLAQYERRGDGSFRLETARGIVMGKVMNSRELLRRLNWKAKLETVAVEIQGLQRDYERAKLAGDVSALRGHEGAAAARYFKALGALITNPGFTFTQRNRRPPLDPMNSLLSFGYTLLHNHILSLIFAEGLNPYFGNLHGSERKQMFLAFDLIEEFRAPIVDALVIRLINRKSFSPTDFTWPNEQGGVYLQGTARRLFLKRFEERMSLQIAHPDIAEKVSYRRVLQLQVQRYKKAVMEGAAYEPFFKRA